VTVPLSHSDALKVRKTLVLTVGCINYDHDINHFEPIQLMIPRTIRYNYYERLQQLGRKSMNEELLDLAGAEKPDYIFYITYQDQVMLRTLEELRAMGSTLIGWFSDDQWRFDSFSKNLAKYLNFPVTTCRKALQAYRTLGFHPVFCQWGSNPRYYKQTKDPETRYDVTFVGGCHGGRPEFIDALRREGIRVKAFGRGWNKRISFDDMIRVFIESKINLNFSTSSVDPSLKQIKGRVFEIPMCGGFLLTEYASGLEEWFELGAEIACFTGVREAVERIRYYLGREEERRQVAEAGCRRAMKCHSWDSRLRQVFRAVEDMERESPLSPRPGIVERFCNRVFQR
jgi:spore maturation protein CgeB